MRDTVIIDMVILESVILSGIGVRCKRTPMESKDPCCANSPVLLKSPREFSTTLRTSLEQ